MFARRAEKKRIFRGRAQRRLTPAIVKCEPSIKFAWSSGCLERRSQQRWPALNIFNTEPSAECQNNSRVGIDVTDPGSLCEMADAFTELHHFAMQHRDPADPNIGNLFHQCKSLIERLRIHRDESLVLHRRGEVDAKEFTNKGCCHSMDFLVNCVLYCNLLRNDKQLRLALSLAIQVLLPPSSSERLQQKLRNDAEKYIDPGTVSRARLAVDAAYMLLVRTKISQMIASDPGGICSYVMIDASEQGGRDFELVYISIIRRRDTIQIFLDFLKLMDSMNISGAARASAVGNEEKLLQGWHDKVFSHITPPVLLGSRAGTLAHKFEAFIHQGFLLSESKQVLKALTASGFGFCTDLGTEAGLHRIKSTPLSDVLPWAYTRRPLPDRSPLVLIGLGMGDPPSPGTSLGPPHFWGPWVSAVQHLGCRPTIPSTLQLWHRMEGPRMGDRDPHRFQGDADPPFEVPPKMVTFSPKMC